MAIRKRPDGSCQVFCYDPAKKRKVYIKPADFGYETPLTERKARDLERRAITHYKKGGKPADAELTVREYAQEWFEHHHGEGTRRPSPNTLTQNELNLRGFLEEFGDRPIDGGIARKEALRWAKKHGYKARAAAALFNDAFDDEETKANPFANRRESQPRGRKDIVPLTEQEVERLGEIALVTHGDYGLMCRAWILFLAWVGARPGETFGLDWPALDFEEGLVTVTRIKGRKQTDRIVFPRRAQEAVLEIPGLRTGRLFSTVQGKRLEKGAVAYYWRDIRAAFIVSLDPERRKELLAVKGALDPYALRHACASWIVANGGDEYDVSAQLGNTPEVARANYVHDFEERRLERLQGLLGGSRVSSLEVVRQRRGG